MKIDSRDLTWALSPIFGVSAVGLLAVGEVGIVAGAAVAAIWLSLLILSYRERR